MFKNFKFVKFLGYPIAIFVGLSIAIIFIFIGIQLASLFGPPTEIGYLGALFGLLLGIPFGSFVSGSIISPILGSNFRWLKAVLISPGTWIGLFFLGIQMIQFNVANEYFKEALIPCLIGVALSVFFSCIGIYFYPKAKKK